MLKYNVEVGDMMETTGERIKKHREALKLTQEELAAKINTSPQNIYKYEKGIVQNIPLGKIQALSEIFGITPSSLVGWRHDPYAEIRRSAQEKSLNDIDDLSPVEKAIISAYRTRSPELQAALLRFLDIEPQNTEFHKEEIAYRPAHIARVAAPPMEPLRSRKEKDTE